MVFVTITETGTREKNSKEFGYKVYNDVQGYRSLDYRNRAKLINGQYLLEEKNWSGVSSIPFNRITIVKNQEVADNILYGKVKKAAKKALENLVPILMVDEQILKKIKEKKSKKHSKETK